MQNSIKFLEELAKVDCGCGEDENHDCDNCPYCEARTDLNEIGDITSSSASAIIKKYNIVEQ